MIMVDTKIRLINASELSDEERSAWRAIQANDPQFDSAFFHPHFAWLVNQVLHDVEVGIVEEDGKPVVFFPFQRLASDIGLPVSRRLAEFHGVIAAPDVHWDVERLVRACDLRAWCFDHLICSQPQFSAHIWGHDDSPTIDIGDGFDSYASQIRQSGSAAITQIMRKSRKMEREIGPLRFEYHHSNQVALDRLIAWKGDQHQRTGRLEIFDFPWVKELLQSIQGAENDGFSAPLSALFAGDALVAVHLGLRSDRVLHWWFPAFDRNFERYSPGLILMVHLLQQCCSLGIDRLDLGKGPERYKMRFKTADRPLAIGAVDFRPWISVARRQWHRTKRRLRSSPLKRQFESFMRVSNQLRERRMYR